MDCAQGLVELETLRGRSESRAPRMREASTSNSPSSEQPNLVPSIVSQSPPLLFICHASEDNDLVDHLVKELDRRALHAWYHKREILVGDSIVGRINEALTNARHLIVVLSPRSVAQPWVTRELNSTLIRQLAEERITILPALIADCDIPPLLADTKYADFRQSFDGGLEELIAAIRAEDSR